MRKLIKKYHFEDMSAFYFTDETKRVELVVGPSLMDDKICIDKAGVTDSLIQFCEDGEGSSSGFSQGHTERNSLCTYELKFINQECVCNDDVTIVKTYFEYKEGVCFTHFLSHRKNDRALKIWIEVTNNGRDDLLLSFFSSFSLGMLTPYSEGETFNRLKYYRLRSRWSAEGYLEKGAIEELQLEPSWARHGISVEKFGQIGSMPVRKFIPLCGIEDEEEGVIFAASLAIASSWQMELYRRDESLCLSGGIADFEFGHWLKRIEPGNSFTTPQAYITACKGSFDKAVQRLLDLHEKSLLFRGVNGINTADTLPAVFNEYCTTWGKPSHDNILKIIDAIKDKGFDYFVIDAGWYTDAALGWENTMGDWVISKELFPQGLRETVNCIKDAGMKPGIWFELESVGTLAKVLSETDHLLKRNGKLIRSGDRYFFDMRDKWTREYLKTKVIDFLYEYGFAYVKIDYNESIGVGCDNAESLGSGLYDTIMATKKFFCEIHDNVPGICIELCSSGGHRLEPSFLNITDMASFSDAHEEVEIPVIAANVHRIMRPEKSQIWCVVRENDSDRRLCYSLCNTFLGVLCISGDVTNLSNRQWQLILDALKFYRSIDSLIKDGETEYFGNRQRCYRKLEGWQGIVRRSPDKKNAYIVINSFSENAHINIDLGGEYTIVDTFEEYKHNISVKNGVIDFMLPQEYSAVALRLKRLEL